MKNDWLIISNPAAGRGDGFQKVNDCLEYLKSRDVHVAIRETRGPGDAEALGARGVTEGFRRFLALGGDGTVHEMLNGIMRDGIPDPPVIIGQLPVGTGNDWLRSVGVPLKPRKILELIATEKTVPHDAGRIRFASDRKEQARYFITMAGFGFDALVARRTHRRDRRKSLGRFAYLVNIFRCLHDYTAPRMIVTDDEHEYTMKVFSLNAAVGPYSGGGMRLSPSARIDDGLLDVTIIKKIGLPGIGISFPLLYTGHIGKHPRVITWRSRRLKIDADPSVPFQIDGEVSGSTPAEVTIIPHAFRAVAPRRQNLSPAQ